MLYLQKVTEKNSQRKKGKKGSTQNKNKKKRRVFLEEPLNTKAGKIQPVKR